MGTEEKQLESHKHEPSAKVETEEDVPSCHTCGVCGRSFPLLSSLSQHMRRHTREKPYKCPYCEHRTAQKGSLKAHIRSHKLGLLNHKISDKELEGDQGQKRHADIVDAPEFISTPDKAHNVNGKVKKKVTKKDRSETGPFSCTICEQVFPQLLLLKSHIKRHHGSQDHGCRICGRRFRQAWFLQSHMRIHRVKAQLQGNKINEPPATINGVLQDRASLTNEECHYELCAGCGNFFQDQKTLHIHEKLHKLNQGFSQNSMHKAADISDRNADKTLFLESLHLKCAELEDRAAVRGVAKRIPELDPVCSYQAWQLATRGRLVEASEKCFGWEERLADAEVAYDTEKGEYVPLKQEKKRKQIDTSNSSVKRRKCDSGLEHNIGNTKSGDKKVCQKERIVLNGLGHAFYEALQTKKIKEVHVSSKVNFSNQEKEGKKTYSCEHCDFHTVEASLLRSHLHTQHLGFYNKQSTILNNGSRSGSKSSKYMDYLRSRSVLLSQPYWNICTYPPEQDLTKANIKIEKPDWTEVTADGNVAVDGVSLLNLSLLATGEKCSITCPIKAEDLVRHQCPYCSHNTNYPEVLWIHQRVSHKVDSNSSVAPKWAPCMNSLKSSKAGGCQWRRTGPPPFLEGKDCPSLPGPRTQRTQPPGIQSQGSSKHSTTKSKHYLKEICPPDGIQRKSSEQKRAVEGGGKGSTAQGTLSNNSVRAKSVPNLQPTSSLKHRGKMAPEEGIFPQEGLGFMLARNHGGTSSNTDRHYTHRKSCEFSSGPKGPDLWSTMNMWRLSGGKTYLDPLLFAQGNSESTGETPADTDIFSLLKNYSPHDLAAFYQHWGFVDPRLDPQAMMQLNGSFGNEVQSASEASKQVNSHSSSSSGSNHKAT